MRSIHTDEITKNIKEMCIEANIFLSEDVKSRIIDACRKETDSCGRKVLEQLVENMEIAETEAIPICQDTGMAIVFAEIGQEVHIEGIDFEAAINEGIRKGYVEGYLRKSVVSPLQRKNTEDNTPGIIYVDIVPGDRLKLTVTSKGFGSENMSRIVMLKPSDGIDGVKNVILETVKNAGPNSCPPFVVGVGIGGTFEKCALLAKKALIRKLGSHSSDEMVKILEEEMMEKINNLKIGPGGLGGVVTALGVNIETYPTHIAGLPVAVNMCCHVDRHVSRML